MSKTTLRYGKPQFIARLAPEHPAKPSKKLLRQWARQDEAAVKLYGKRYDALGDKEKVNVHYTLNVAKEAMRRKAVEKAEKPADLQVYQEA